MEARIFGRLGRFFAIVALIGTAFPALPRVASAAVCGDIHLVWARGSGEVLTTSVLTGAVLVLAGCTSAATPTSAPPSPSVTPEPSKPVPTATAAAEVLQVKVTFDGDKCVYEGPRVFLDGTEVRFEFAPTAAMAPTSALVVGPVIEGMSRDQVEEDLQGHPASVPPTWLMSWSSSYGPGTFIHTMSRTEESKPVGGYVVACLTSPETTDATYFTELLLVAGS